MRETSETIYRRITTEAAAHLQIRRAVFVLLTMSMLVNIALSIYLLTKEDRTRTVVIAPESAEPYVAMTESVSANLLERFSIASLGLVLNMSPQTAAWQTETFLKYVAPESYGEIASSLRRAAASLERNQAATAFFAEAATVDPETMTTCVTGERRTMIGKAVTDASRMAACLKSTVRLGRLWIVQLTISEEKKKAEAADEPPTGAAARSKGKSRPQSEDQRASAGIEP